MQRKFIIGKATTIVDAFAESVEEVILIEVNGRVETKMKTATMNKVLKDTLKMLLIERANTDIWRGKRVRKVLVFLDKVARDSFGPKAWVNEAWAAFGVETHVCAIPEVYRDMIIKAQKAQDLRNDSRDEETVL